MPETTPQVTDPVETAEVAALPEIPEYITFEFINEYIEACAEEVQQRFTTILTNAGLLEYVNGMIEEHPEEVARSIIVDMFMAAI